MEKKNWVRPQATVEKFVANEYVAACGDNNVIYNFECNAGNSGTRYAVKDASGGYATISGYYLNGNDNALKDGTYYSSCGRTHKAAANSGFLTGYHLDDPKTPGDENISVIIWTDNGRNVHCTPKINMNEWTTAKS